MITAPGEMDPAYFRGRTRSQVKYRFPFGRKVYPFMPSLKKNMDGIHRAILGQANNYLSYMIHKSDNVGWWNFRHPNYYEEGVTIGKHFGDEVGNKLMQMLGSSERYSKRKIYPTREICRISSGWAFLFFHWKKHANICRLRLDSPNNLFGLGQTSPSKSMFILAAICAKALQHRSNK